MVIFQMLSSDTLVPLFQPISMYFMIIFTKLSSDTLGVPSDLKVGIMWSFSQNYHLTPWYPCFNLKVGII